MEVECPTCGKEFGDVHIDHERGRARCPICSTSFNIPEEVDERANDWATPGDVDDEADDDRPEIPVPESISIERRGSELIMRWSWRDLRAALILLMTPLMFLWLYSMGTELRRGVNVEALIMVSILVPWFYWALAKTLNRTRIDVTNGRIAVDHGPVFWPGNDTLAAGRIDQLYCERRKDWWALIRERNRMTPRDCYTVCARLKDGTSRDFVDRLKDREHALYIEHQIEKHLGIEDRQVAGEVV